MNHAQKQRRIDSLVGTEPTNEQLGIPESVTQVPARPGTLPMIERCINAQVCRERNDELQLEVYRTGCDGEVSYAFVSEKDIVEFLNQRGL